jgi:predicted metal-dependent phosphoesterase TrpH
MKIDLHCHSTYSGDSFLEPEALVERALELGLQGVCLTEHHSYEASAPAEQVDLPAGFVLLRGVEISTAAGHLLAYGLQDDRWNRWSQNNYLDLDGVIEQVHAHGGICVPAHPFRGGDSMGWQLFERNGFDAVESHNGRNQAEMNTLAVNAATKLGLPMVGGSDCHHVSEVGRAFTVFDAAVRTIDDVVESIRSGACRGEGDVRNLSTYAAA